MKVHDGSNRVIWAVSPFVYDEKLQFSTFRALVKLTEKSNTLIEPVVVLSPEEQKVPIPAFRAHSKDYQLEVQKIIESWRKKLKNPRLLSPTLLSEDMYSSHVSADALLRYAKESGAGLIAMGTHKRKAISRFFFGSFAESMILKSDIPLLVVNPKSPSPKKISKILFPTDFSDASLFAYRTLLPTANALGAKVIVYYKFEYVVAQTGEMVFYVPDYDRYLRDDKKAKQKQALEWAEMAERAGVKAEVVLDDKASFLPESIIRFAQKSKADMIALASHSGSVTATLLGSVARQVVRSSRCPVWVIHPPKEFVRERKERTVNEVYQAAGGNLR